MTPTFGARRTRATWLAAVVAASALGLAACGSDSASGGSGGDGAISVAIVGDFSGPFSGTITPSIIPTFKAAIAQINKDGGIDGRKITTKDFDTLSTADGAVASARAAVAARPTFIFDTALSTTWAAQVPVLDQAGIPTITENAVLDDPPKKWMFQPIVVSQIPDYLETGVRQVVNDGDADGSIEGTKIAMTVIDTAGATPLADDFVSNVKKAGADVVAYVKRAPDATTFTSQAQEIAGADPDVVVIHDGGVGPGLITDALAVAGYTGPIIFTYGTASQSAFLAKYPNSDLWAAYQFADLADRPDFAPLLQAVGAKLPDVVANGTGQPGWVSAEVAAEALRNCTKSCDSAGLIKALESIQDYTVPGDLMLGKVSMSADNHTINQFLQFYHLNAAGTAAEPAADPFNVSG